MDVPTPMLPVTSLTLVTQVIPSLSLYLSPSYSVFSSSLFSPFSSISSSKDLYILFRSMDFGERHYAAQARNYRVLCKQVLHSQSFCHQHYSIRLLPIPSPSSPSPLLSSPLFSSLLFSKFCLTCGRYVAM